MPISSARLVAWADIARKRAETLDNFKEAAQLLELAKGLDALVIWRRTQRRCHKPVPRRQPMHEYPSAVDAAASSGRPIG